MVHFDFITGKFYEHQSMTTFRMRAGAVPYYDRAGRYVGCLHRTRYTPDDSMYFNPHTRTFSGDIRNLDW